MSNDAAVLSTDQEKISGYAVAAFILSFLAYGLDYLDLQMLANTARLIGAEFHIAPASMGVLLGAQFIGAGIGGLFGGWLADKIGRVKTMAVCLFWFSTFTILIPLCTSYEQLLACRILVGMGLGAQWGVGMTITAEWMPAKWRLRATAVIFAASSVGLISGALLTAALVPAYGWRSLFYCGAIGYVFCLGVLFVKDPPLWHAAKARADKGEVVLGSIKVLLGNPVHRFRFICAFFVCLLVVLAYWGTASWIPTWLMKEKGLSIVKSMEFLYAIGGGAICGYLFLSTIMGKFGRKKPAIFFVILSIPATLMFASIDDARTLLLFTPLWAFITCCVMGIFGGYFAELFPTEIRGLAVNGIWNVSRILVFFAPILFAAISAATSMGFAIKMTGVLYALALIPLFLLPETKGQVLK